MERKRPKVLLAGDRGGAVWLAGVMMICRFTSIGVRGCHRRDAGPRAVAAGEARGRVVAAAAGRGQGESSRRAVARSWALGLALPGGRLYRPRPGSPRPGLLLGATWGAVFGLPLSMGARLRRCVVPALRDRLALGALSNKALAGSRWRLTTFSNHSRFLSIEFPDIRGAVCAMRSPRVDAAHAGARPSHSSAAGHPLAGRARTSGDTPTMALLLHALTIAGPTSGSYLLMPTSRGGAFLASQTRVAIRREALSLFGGRRDPFPGPCNCPGRDGAARMTAQAPSRAETQKKVYPSLAPAKLGAT